MWRTWRERGRARDGQQITPLGEGICRGRWRAYLEGVESFGLLHGDAVRLVRLEPQIRACAESYQSANARVGDSLTSVSGLLIE